MGILNELKKLTRPYDEEDEEFEDFTPRAPEKIPVTPRTAAVQRSSFVAEERKEINKVVNIHATAQLQVAVVRPEDYKKSGPEIADHLREKHTVVMNLEELKKRDKFTAQRVLDFASGAAYAQDGKIKKIAVDTYLITPYNVDLLDDIIDELENNGMSF